MQERQADLLSELGHSPQIEQPEAIANLILEPPFA